MQTHYELLGVPNDADTSAIKLAWAKAVRQHPPDKNPDMNRLLNEAKACLLDQRSRQSYDERLEFGDELDDYYSTGYQHFTDAEYSEAIVQFSLLLSMAPSRDDARWFLALSYEYLEDYDRSEGQYKILLEHEPERAIYAYGLADMYKNWGGIDVSKYHDAEKYYLLAISLESYNSQYYRGRASCLIDQAKYTEAEQCVYDAINADGQTDIDDIDSIMLLLSIFTLTDRTDRFVEITELIQECIAFDDDRAAYAAHRVIQESYKYKDSGGKWSVCNLMIDIARGVVDDLGESDDFAKAAEFYAMFDGELDSIGDVGLDNFTQAIISYYAGVKLGYINEDSEVVDQLHKGAQMTGAASLTQSWTGAQQTVPMLCFFVAAEVQELINSVSVIRKLTAGIPVLSQAVQRVQAFEARSDENKKYVNYALIAAIAGVTFFVMKGCSG